MATGSADAPPHTYNTVWLKDVVNTEHRDPAWADACGSEESATKFLAHMSSLLSQFFKRDAAPLDPSAAMAAHTTKWQQCAWDADKEIPPTCAKSHPLLARCSSDIGVAASAGGLRRADLAQHAVTPAVSRDNVGKCTGPKPTCAVSQRGACGGGGGVLRT